MLKNKETLILGGLTILSAIILLYNIYEMFSLREAYNMFQRQLLNLQRKNAKLEFQLRTKEKELKELIERKDRLIDTTVRKFSPFNSPELIAKRISSICVKNKIQILNLDSQPSSKGSYTLTTTVELKGKEKNILETVNDILNSFPLKNLKCIGLFNSNGTNLKMSWKTPVINIQELKNEN